MATNNREQKYIFVPLRDKSQGKLKLQRIETQTGDGIADVIGTNRNGQGFWLELKYLEKWPARVDTCPLKGAFEKGQKSFLASWRDWNFNTFLLLKVDVHYYLIKPTMGLDLYNKNELLQFVVAWGDAVAIIDHLENNI